jgi:hypothetical protein
MTTQRTCGDAPRCDAEIGSTKRGWHGCGRKAIIRVTRRSNYSGHELVLNYCSRHEWKRADREHYTTVLVRALPVEICSACDEPMERIEGPIEWGCPECATLAQENS